MKETLGAKIRNALSPYHNLIEMVNDGGFKEEDIQSVLKDPVHKKCIQNLIEISKECEIEPSDELINKLDQ